MISSTPHITPSAQNHGQAHAQSSNWADPRLYPNPPPMINTPQGQQNRGMPINQQLHPQAPVAPHIPYFPQPHPNPPPMINHPQGQLLNRGMPINQQLHPQAPVAPHIPHFPKPYPEDKLPTLPLRDLFFLHATNLVCSNLSNGLSNPNVYIFMVNETLTQHGYPPLNMPQSVIDSAHQCSPNTTTNLPPQLPHQSTPQPTPLDPSSLASTSQDHNQTISSTSSFASTTSSITNTTPTNSPTMLQTSGASPLQTPPRNSPTTSLPGPNSYTPNRLLSPLYRSLNSLFNTPSNTSPISIQQQDLATPEWSVEQ